MSELGLDGRRSPDSGSVGAGFLTGCLIQGFIQFSLFIWLLSEASASKGQAKGAELIYGIVELSQWMILIPLIRRARGRGEDDTRHGLVISATIAALIGTACGGAALSEVFR